MCSCTNSFPRLECFNLFRRQIDRTRELSTGGLGDCEVADGCTARALGDTAMEPGNGRRSGQAIELAGDRQLASASVAVAEPLPVTLGRSVGVVGTHPSRAV